MAARLEDGRIALFEAPEPHRPSFNRGEQLILHFANQVDASEGYRLQNFDGLNYLFYPSLAETSAPNYAIVKNRR